MGSWVRVKDMAPPGHVRTPYYLRGKRGQIERELGPFHNPEQLAYNRKASAKKLFRVRFKMDEVWGEDTPFATDTLDAEIYEHWLEPIDAP